MLTCTLCGWRHLEESAAVVPPLDVITEGRKIALEGVILWEHALCRRCAARVRQGCEEAVFHPFLASKALIAHLLEKQAERKAAEAEREARIAAEVEKFRRTVLTPVETPTGKNGKILSGAAKAAVERKKFFHETTARQNQEHDQRRAARRARLEAERAERELERVNAALTAQAYVS